MTELIQVIGHQVPREPEFLHFPPYLKIQVIRFPMKYVSDERRTFSDIQILAAQLHHHDTCQSFILQFETI